MKKTSPQIEEKVIELYNEKNSMKEIASILNGIVNQTTVFNILRRNGIDTSKKTINIEELKDLYLNQNMLISDIAIRMGCDVKTVYNHMHKNDIDLKVCYKNPNLDHNFFETIDNEIKAYFVGFILADGCVTKRKDSGSISLQISIKSKDDYILNILKENIGSSNILSKNNRDETKFSIHSQKICSDLSQYNIVPRKTNITSLPKNIDDNLMPHLIRGLIDGDGWICKRKNGTYNINLCGTSDLVTDVRNYLTETLGLYNVKICVSHTTFDNPAYFISYCSKGDVKKLANFLYTNATIFLTRKFDKVKELL